jgi:hypothetical protein
LEHLILPINGAFRFIQQERYAINVRGENKRSTLLSPTFDLSNVKNPGYNLRHSFQVEEHFLPRMTFNRSKILQNAFKVLVSAKFNDKMETYDLVSVSGSPVTTYQRFNVTDTGLTDDGVITAREAANSQLPSCLTNPTPEQSPKCIVVVKPRNTIVIKRTINLPPKQEISLALRYRLTSQSAPQGAKIKNYG